MKRNDLDTFDKLSGQLVGVYDELAILSKKNPNDAVNKFKLKFINSLISESNIFLTTSYRPFTDFEIFDSDEIPENSDVVFILTQYIQCFEKFRADNVIQKHGQWFWKIKGEKHEAIDDKGMIYLITTSPKKLRD